MDSKILLASTLLVTLGCHAAGKLIMKPRDTDVKVKHSTYFNCSTDIGSTAIFWFHGAKYVYTGIAILEPYHERFEINRNTLNGTYIYNLVIHSVQPGDAGKYICTEDEGVGETYSVQLVVLDDDPICRSNRKLDEIIGQNTCHIEPDEVELECSVTYHGNIPPQMQWKKVGENSSTPLEVSLATSSNNFVSTLKLKGDIALNNASYVCETKRTTQEPNKCTSQVIKILYAISDYSTVNKTINDEIHCIANTSQSCSYQWKWLQDNDFTIESSSSVLKARKLGWHRCEAEFYLRNKTCNLLVMRAMVYGEAESSKTKTIIISVVVSVVGTVVVIGVLICVFIWIVNRRVHSAQGPQYTRAGTGQVGATICEEDERSEIRLPLIPDNSSKSWVQEGRLLDVPGNSNGPVVTAIPDKNEPSEIQHPLLFQLERLLDEMDLRGRIEALKDLIRDRVDPDFGLLDELLVSQSLTGPEVAKVKAVSDSHGRSRTILEYVSDKGIYINFLYALRDTQQTHLVNFILSNGKLLPEFGDDWPLTEREISILDTNQGSLVDLLETCDLLPHLYSHKVVNDRQRDFVSSKTTSLEKNHVLLEILRRTSLQNYNKTIYCLQLSNQSHIADILKKGGVVRHRSELETESDVNMVENELITKFTEILCDRSLDDAARILELAARKVLNSI